MADKSTILIARIMGPALVIFGVSLLAGRVDFPGLANAVIGDATLRLFASAISLILGLVIVALHNRWGRPLETAITLVGWVLILRGASLLLSPPEMLSAMLPLIRSAVLPMISGGLMLAIGAWFSFVGLTAKSGEPGEVQEVGSVKRKGASGV